MHSFLLGVSFLISFCCFDRHLSISHSSNWKINVSSQILIFVFVFNNLHRLQSNNTQDEDAPWGNENLTGEEAVNYFYDDIIGGGTVGDDQKPTRIVARNVGFAFLTWFIVFLCVAWGVKWTGRIAYFTMGFPIILLFVFLGKALTLEGSSEGVKQYIGIWDMSILKERPEVWSVACSQIFFSIGLTFGILTAFGSHCPRDEPAVTNAIVISLANSAFSIIAGFAVFAALGHLAVSE